MTEMDSVSIVDKTTLKLFTWNVLHPDHTNVHEADISQLYLDWRYRLSLIKKNIQDNNPDMICLQEVESISLLEDYAEFIVDYHLIYQNDKRRLKAVNKWILADKPIDFKPNTLVCATFVRKSVCNITNVVIGSRTLTTTIVLNETKKSITITNVHLEAGRGVNEIHIKHLSKLTTSDIICGDFNDFPGEPAMKFMSDELKLRSVWEIDGIVVADNKEDSTVDKKDKDHTPITFRYHEKIWTLDYIYYKDCITPIELLITTAFTGLTKTHPSDHLWVCCNLVL
jgi:mRNA deadenylase 3'-5' endonuclease subunit Ccr4